MYLRGGKYMLHCPKRIVRFMDFWNFGLQRGHQKSAHQKGILYYRNSCFRYLIPLVAENLSNKTKILNFKILWHNNRTQFMWKLNFVRHVIETCYAMDHQNIVCCKAESVTYMSLRFLLKLTCSTHRDA